MGVLRDRKTLILRVTSDCVCIILIAAGIFAIKHGTSPYHRGFFCDDESIQHPVLEDTISVTLAACVGALLPVFVIILVEFLLRKKSYGPNPSFIKFTGIYKSWIRSSYNAVGVFIFGMAVTQFLTEIGKYSIGRLRPHFLTLCNPDMTKVNCSAGYITEDVCTSTDTEMMIEARLSFPSGHSSFSMYCMLYLILYLQARVSLQAIALLKPLSQLILFCMGFYTCLSRISDYKHHWSDVLSGAILGIGVCIFVIVSLTDFGQLLWNRKSFSWGAVESFGPSIKHNTVEEGLDVPSTVQPRLESEFSSRSLRVNENSRESADQSHTDIELYKSRTPGSQWPGELVCSYTYTTYI